MSLWGGVVLFGKTRLLAMRLLGTEGCDLLSGDSSAQLATVNERGFSLVWFGIRLEPPLDQRCMPSGVYGVPCSASSTEGKYSTFSPTAWPGCMGTPS